METRRTPLYDFHLANGARMVPFAGWDMPVQYADGIKAEHLATRAGAGLFDVSHMAQIWLTGSDADAALERLTPTDVGAIAEGRVRYSLFLDDNGGVLDDLMIARLDGDLQLVVNAGRADHDIAHLRANLDGANLDSANLDSNVTMQVRDDRALLALQGPQAPHVLHRLGVDLDGFVFMQVRHVAIDGVDCIVTRSGYTGEDGFEISLPEDIAEAFVTALCGDGRVKMAGLVARDSLRLEAGLCLYGQDMDENISVAAASLEWAIPKIRRIGGARAGGFIGAEHTLPELQDGAAMCRIGVLAPKGVPPRSGALIFDAETDGNQIGLVTSGAPSPCVGQPVAMVRVVGEAAIDGPLFAEVRGKRLALERAKMPFVAHRFYRGGGKGA